MARYGQRRRSTRGSRWMDLRYAGICKVCGDDVAQGARGFYDADARTITCTKLDCAEADKLVRYEALTGPWDKRTDLRVLGESRYGEPAPISFQRAAHNAARRAAGPGVHVATFNSGESVFVNARGRCEDAPCCGCCS